MKLSSSWSSHYNNSILFVKNQPQISKMNINLMDKSSSATISERTVIYGDQNTRNISLLHHGKSEFIRNGIR